MLTAAFMLPGVPQSITADTNAFPNKKGDTRSPLMILAFCVLYFYVRCFTFKIFHVGIKLVDGFEMNLS